MELARKRQAMLRGAGHLLNRALSRGWGAWVEMAEDRAAFMQKLRKGLSYMVNRQRARSFASWLEYIAPRDDPMSRAMAHFVNRELSRGWVGWHTRWSAAARSWWSSKRPMSASVDRATPPRVHPTGRRSRMRQRQPQRGSPANGACVLHRHPCPAAQVRIEI